MTKIISSLLALLISFSLANSQSLDITNNPVKSDNFKPYEKDRENRLQKKNPLFSLDLDLQAGMLVSKASFDRATSSDTTQNFEDTKSKIGPTAGLTLSLNLLGFGLTSGLVYTGKGFKVVQPSTTSEDIVNLNFLNIPLLFHFDFEVGRVIIDGNVGPYFGILTGGDEEQSFGNSVLYKIKNFDLGLTGNLQFAYMFNKYLGALLGSKFEYGGLNNLGNNSFFNSIRTQSYHFYTGMKFML